MKKLKTFEQYGDQRDDPEFLARWVYEENYKDKKTVFTNDVIEYLTSYFGIGKRYNRKSLTKIINDIFDLRMLNKPINYDYNSKICRQMDVKKYDDFNDEESSIIESIIDVIWNG
jgi:hypothetical protein